MNFIKNLLAKFKIKNKSAIRHGSYSIALIAVAVAAVIILNVLMGVLSERGVLSFDITTDKSNTMSQENIEFLKTVDKPVTITMLSTADAYTGGTMSEFASTYLYVMDDSNYYSQTINILNQYPQINSNIKVVYEDFYGAKTESLSEQYKDLFYGDILVEYTNNAGQTATRLIGFDDIYTYSDDSGYAAMGYGYYNIDGNNIETALSSAINTLISEDTKNIGIISAHSNTAIFETLYAPALKLNGFNITDVSGTIVQSIPNDTDILIITAPTTDFLPSEITVISEWLDNGGNKDKSLIFVPGASMSRFPVLSQFLKEWGIEYSNGLLYQTDSDYYYGDPTTMPMFANNSDLTKEIMPSTGNFSLLSSNLVMKTAYETYSSRKTNVIVSTNDTVTVAPEGAAETWKPESNAKCEIYPGLIVTAEEGFVENERHVSYVAAFSSQEFIYSSWAQTDSVQNMDVAVNTAMFISGMNTNKKVFIPKTITTESFSSLISQSEVLIIQALFVIVLPIVIVICGIVVWVRRKRK